MADSSTDLSANTGSAHIGSAHTGSANAAEIPVLEGQSCIGELLPDFQDVVGIGSPAWALTDAVESADGQQMLF